MKKIILTLIMAVLALGVNAGVEITKVDKVSPTDEMFLDMAVTAARKSKSSGQKPLGAVIILNGAWRSTGLPAAGATPEQAAYEKSRRTTLNNATVYTLAEPTTEAYNLLCRLGADGVVFVIDRAGAVAAGLYPADAYDDSKIDATLAPVPMKQMPYADADALIK